MSADPRLQRIAAEISLVADSRNDWSEEARAALRVLASRVEGFNPKNPVDVTLPATNPTLDITARIAALRGRLTPDAFEVMDAELINGLSRRLAHEGFKGFKRKKPIPLTEQLLADLYKNAITTFWGMVEHSSATQHPRDEPPVTQ